MVPSARLVSALRGSRPRIHAVYLSHRRPDDLSGIDDWRSAHGAGHARAKNNQDLRLDLSFGDPEADHLYDRGRYDDGRAGSDYRPRHDGRSLSAAKVCG